MQNFEIKSVPTLAVLVSIAPQCQSVCYTVAANKAVEVYQGSQGQVCVIMDTLD